MARLAQLMFGSRYTWLEWQGMKVYSSPVIEQGACEMASIEGVDFRIYVHPADVAKMGALDGYIDHLVTGQD